MILIAMVLVSCNPKQNASPGICLSFDDRSILEWNGMLDLLDKYDAKVTFFVTQFDSLSAEEVSMLRNFEQRGHEIGSHGAMHVQSEQYIRDNSYKAYLEKEVDQSLASMRSKGFNPVSFAYPFGAKYWFTDNMLLNRFEVTRGVEEARNLDAAYYDFGGNRNLSAVGIDRGAGLTRDMVLQAMVIAKEKQRVLLLYGHAPGNEQQGPYVFDVAFLEWILKEAEAKDLQFYRMSDIAAPDR